MRIIELKKPNLPKVNMECDKPIDKKLEEIPAIKQCFSKSSTTIISGGCGSGKTTFLIQLVKSIFNGCFEEIILFMPENSFESLNEKDRLYLQKYLVTDDGDSTIYHEFDAEILQEIYSKLEDNARNKYHTLLLIDDWGHMLKDRPIERLLKKICLKNRHLKTSTMILTQNYYMLSCQIREIMNNVVMFNTNKAQNEKLFEEQFSLKKKQFNELMTLLPTIHDYLILDQKHKKIFHNWNEVVFDDEEQK